jgi:hypothetical protein
MTELSNALQAGQARERFATPVFSLTVRRPISAPGTE